MFSSTVGKSVLNNNGKLGEVFNDYTNNTAAGDFAHAEGEGTKASGKHQHVQGKYNIEDTSNTYAHIVGNGTSSAKSNAHTLDWNGNAWFKGDVFVNNTNQGTGIKLQKSNETYNENTGLRWYHINVNNTSNFELDTNDVCIVSYCWSKNI